MKILVTGASGFIGSNLVPRLSDYEVYHPLSEVMDMTKPNSIRDYFEEVGGVDLLIHLASSVPRSNAENFNYYLVNAVGTANICRYAKFDRIIFLSSKDVYGDYGYFSEVDECHPKTHYAVSKLLAEKYVEMTERYCILRASCVYGVSDTNLTRLIPQAMKAGVSREDLEIWGSGKALRDYLYIDDAVSAIVAALQSQRGNEVYNVGYGESISKEDLFRAIAELCGVRVVYNPEKGGEASQCNLMSISKAEKELGWKPRVNWWEGIRRTHEFWRGYIK